MLSAYSARLDALALAERVGAVERHIRHEAPPRIADYLATLFPQQSALVASDAPQNAALTSRRSGKSSTTPALLFDAGHRFPGAVVYYIHPDGGSKAMETVMGPDINLSAINDAYSLGWRVNLTTRTLTNPRTRTEIRIRGADDAREVKKFRGDRVSRVVIDECQNFPSALLQRLVESDVGPGLADMQGQLFLLGTPGDVCADDDFWFSITRNDTGASEAKRRRDWRVFSWCALDNPHVRVNMAQRLAAQLSAVLDGMPEDARPTDKAWTAAAMAEAMLAGGERRAEVALLAAVIAPHIYREGFGRWTKDGTGLLFRFDDTRNTYDGLPRGHVWRKVLGVDLGTGDAFALEVLAFSPTHPVIYEVASYKETGLHADDWRELTAKAQKEHNPIATVVDEGGLGHGVVKAWRERHAMHCDAADKSEKLAHIVLLNSALEKGRVKVLPEGEAAKEWASLKRKPGTSGTALQVIGQDHASDAFLYAWRKAVALSGLEDKPAPLPGTPEAREEARRAEKEKALQQMRAQQRQQRILTGGLIGSRGGRR